MIYISHTHIYITFTREYYSTLKRKETLSFRITWMRLDGIMLTEIRQTDRQKTSKAWYHIYTDFFFKGKSRIHRNRNRKVADGNWEVGEIGKGW